MNDNWTRDDWLRVGEAVRHRVRDELRMSYKEVADRGGPSDTKITNLIKKGEPLARPETRRDLSLAVGWEADGIDRLLRGEEPIGMSPGDGPLPVGVDRLSQRVERLAEIQAGQTSAIEELTAQLRADAARQTELWMQLQADAAQQSELRRQLQADADQQTTLLRQIVALLEQLPIGPGSPSGDESPPRADVPRPQSAS